MKQKLILSPTLLCALALGLSLGAFASTEEKLDKKFSIQPGGTLVVDVEFGSIDVSTNAANEVTVGVWRKVSRSSKTSEEEYLRDHPVNITQEGNTLTVRARSKKSGNNWSWGKSRNEAKYTITVPAQFNAKLDTSGGAIKVADLTGDVKANTSGGGLSFARLHGPLNGETSGGSIHLSACEGTQKIETSGGSIEVAGGSGSLDGETSGGSVAVQKFDGNVKVETSGGGITIDDVTGSIRGSTSGGSIKAKLVSPFNNDVKLETSGGGITIRLPADAAVNLDAETSAGSVTSDIPVTMAVSGKVHRDHIKGTINGGGKQLHLRTSAGSIRVLNREKTTELEAPAR